MTGAHEVRERGAAFLDDAAGEGCEEFLFDVEAYLAMDRAGVFDGKRRTELIEGKIYTMPPISSGHGVGQFRLIQALSTLIRALGREREIGPVNVTLVTDGRSAPDPDVVVAPLRDDDAPYSVGEVLLVCEVAVSSLRRDLGLKRAMYAVAGAPEYWVLDVRGRRLHAFRDPAEDGYADARVLEPGDSISPLFARAGGEIAVADLLS